MDAFPGYTMFDNTHKVLCVIQVVEDAQAGSVATNSVMKHYAGTQEDSFKIEESGNDSTTKTGEDYQAE